MTKRQKKPNRDRKPKAGKPLSRKIHLGDKVWSYRITGMFILVRNPENTETTKISLSEFTGLSWDVLERRDYKSDGTAIAPRHIKAFIENGLKPCAWEYYDFEPSSITRQRDETMQRFAIDILTKTILDSKQEVPANANPKVFEKGTPIFQLHGPRPWMIETWLRDCDTPKKLDWHFSGGIAQVLSLDPDKHTEHLRKTVPALRAACELGQEKHSCGLLELVETREGRFRAGVDEVPPGTVAIG